MELVDAVVKAIEQFEMLSGTTDSRRGVGRQGQPRGLGLCGDRL